MAKQCAGTRSLHSELARRFKRAKKSLEKAHGRALIGPELEAVSRDIKAKLEAERVEGKEEGAGANNTQ